MATNHRDLDVLVIGELNCDLILRGDVTPRFGQVEKLIDVADLTIGSSSAIFACGAARLGLRVGFIGKVGDDTFGRFMVDALRGYCIDTDGIVVDPIVKTGLTVILSRGNDRAILTYLGSIAALRPEEVDRTALARARHLHLGSYFLLDALRPAVPELYAQAKASGLSTSLDTNYDPRETWDGGLDAVLAHTDVFLPNAAELLAITRTAEIETGLAALRGRIPTIAVKLGGEGSRAVQGERDERAGIVPVELVDTTGAGDSFDAGFVYGYLAGWDLARTLRFAGACGSLSTRAAGGTAAQATLAEALTYV